MRLFDVRKMFAPGHESTDPEWRPVEVEASRSVAATGSPLFDAILTFWQTNRSDESVPDWSAFQPADHRHLLPHIVLYECIKGRPFARIVGESVASHLPVKLSNMFLDEVACRGVNDLSDEIAQARIGREPTYAERENVWSRHHDSIGYRTLNLPFRSERDPVDRVLSVMVFQVETRAT